MRDIVITAFIFGVLMLVFKHPHYGIYLWSWIGYMNPHMQAWGFAQTMPFALITAVVTLFAYLFSKEPKRIPVSPEIWLLFLFFMWVTFTSFFAFYPQLVWDQWDKVWKILFMTLVTAAMLTNRQRLEGLVWIIVLSLGFYGLKGGVFTIVHGGVYRVQGPETTFIAGNNELGLALIMTIPLIRYLHLQETRRWLKLGLAGLMILTGLAAIGSQSRGALLAAAAMGLFLWLKSRQKIMMTIYLAAVVGLVAAIMPQEWYDRMNTIQNYEQDASARGRINAWYTAYYVAKENLTGGGFEMFQGPTFRRYAPEPGNVHDVHSIYFEVLGEHGFIGLTIWLLLGLFAWHTGSKVIRRLKNIPEKKWAVDLAAMTQVSMVGYATGGAFLGLAYFDYYYHLVIIMVLVYHIAVKDYWSNASVSTSKPSPPAKKGNAKKWGRRTPAQV